eukprot:Nitzschia sp. Nitz4//scaffold21_size171442//165220//165669//NITZ4_002195-RA/size171442-augustus-gene-0.196-mRNA-1//1//CDS//3329542513//4349//frame0
MIDPMAGLDDGPQGDHDDEKDIIDSTSLRYNRQRVDTVRSVMGIASGCVAGICGFTGLEGLGFFAALYLAVLIVMWAVKMNFNLHGYTRQSWWTYATANTQQSALSFTLFWTLFYGLVYLY